MAAPPRRPQPSLLRPHRRRLSDARFRGATFTGDVGFDQATFTRCTTFAGATGLERAELDGA
ncbi:pentapeptide repeat-containing protein [Nonomuraea bangladeshensis]